MQHHPLHCLGIGLLIRTKQRLLVLPAPGFHHVTYRVALPFGSPLPADRMPHHPPFGRKLRDLVRLPEPRVEQMPTARLRRVLRRSEDGRVSDRALRSPTTQDTVVMSADVMGGPDLSGFMIGTLLCEPASLTATGSILTYHHGATFLSPVDPQMRAAQPMTLSTRTWSHLSQQPCARAI